LQAISEGRSLQAISEGRSLQAISEERSLQAISEEPEGAAFAIRMDSMIRRQHATLDAAVT
jgi:hypothetical protein